MKNNSNNEQTVMNNTKKASRKMMQKANQKRIQAGANARRKVAKSWEKIAQSIKYKRAAAMESYSRTMRSVKNELFEGSSIRLHKCDNEKSYKYKKRLLRRIVEKRQSQSVRRRIGRTNDRFANYMLRRCTSNSMKVLQYYLLYA